ncbi:MAG TPA: (2Fe-2S)-binding protein [Phycisphaerae bacterium]|nr:(2Fe-2S)-binding protein [Phycisphaerae bacterium]
MALKPDDTVCFCFHVSLRKIEAFCNAQKPLYPSQISECLSAGTGCGWCRPMLAKIHTRICGRHAPPWRQDESPGTSPEARNQPPGEIDPDQWAAGRRTYIAEGKGKPPAGAET